MWWQLQAAGSNVLVLCVNDFLFGLKQLVQELESLRRQDCWRQSPIIVAGDLNY
jgi:hypothetical protein